MRYDSNGSFRLTAYDLDLDMVLIMLVSAFQSVAHFQSDVLCTDKGTSVVVSIRISQIRFPNACLIDMSPDFVWLMRLTTTDSWALLLTPPDLSSRPVSMTLPHVVGIH